MSQGDRDARLRARTAANAPSVLAKILDTPRLAAAVSRLPTWMLHGVILRAGLEDCAQLVALATPRQLSAVFDLDLWRSSRPGGDELFDVNRFGLWLDVLAESGAPFAARTLSELDLRLLTAALGQFIAVFDPASSAGTGKDRLGTRASGAGLRADVGGYLVEARRPDAWETIVAVLLALDEEYPDCFHQVMRACRTLSNSKPEADGFHHLPGNAEQLAAELAYERERRREQQGYLTPAQARAFLRQSRHLQPGKSSPPLSPISDAYLRDLTGSTEMQTVSDATPEADEGATEASAVAAIAEVLADAGGHHGLLGGAGPEDVDQSRLHRHLVQAQHHDAGAYGGRLQELAFLANALVAGCSIQSRPFEVREASECAAAVCALGLETWPTAWLEPRSGQGAPDSDTARDLPDDFLVTHDLVTVFQVGWTVLYRDVSLFVAGQLLDILGGVRSRDREVQLGLTRLRGELGRRLAVGAPWDVRDALDVLAPLDLPTWAALTGLLGECPVLLANVRAASSSRPHAISTADFQFISENRQIASVRAFMESLPGSLGP